MLPTARQILWSRNEDDALFKIVEASLSHLNISIQIDRSNTRISIDGKYFGYVHMRKIQVGRNRDKYGHAEMSGEERFSLFSPGDLASDQPAMTSISNPFSLPAWLSIIISIVLFGCIHHVILRRAHKDHSASWIWSLWSVLCPFLCQIPDQRSRHFIISFWIFSSFLVTNFYLAVLTSNEISPAVLKSETKFEDLIKEDPEFRVANFDLTGEALENEKEAKEDACIFFKRNEERREDPFWLKSPLESICESWLKENGEYHGSSKKVKISYFVPSKYLPVFEFYLNTLNTSQRRWDLIKDEIEFGGLFWGFTSPNLELIITSFKRIMQSGIHKYWDEMHDQLNLVWFAMYKDLPHNPNHWGQMLDERREKMERERAPTFENSVLKSAFYLFLIGASTAIVSLRLEVPFPSYILRFCRRARGRIRKLKCHFPFFR